MPLLFLIFDTCVYFVYVTCTHTISDDKDKFDVQHGRIHIALDYRMAWINISSCVLPALAYWNSTLCMWVSIEVSMRILGSFFSGNSILHPPGIGAETWLSIDKITNWNALAFFMYR